MTAISTSGSAHDCTEQATFVGVTGIGTLPTCRSVLLCGIGSLILPVTELPMGWWVRRVAALVVVALAVLLRRITLLGRIALLTMLLRRIRIVRLIVVRRW